MIVCAGEILADMIGESKNGSVRYERKAGGAPFNVACAAKKLGSEVAFVGSVGDDTVGDFLTEYARARGFDELVVKKCEDANTTLAFVDIDVSGERSFCFYRKHTADHRMPKVSASLIERASIIHIGSLMLSESAGRDYAVDLCKRAHAAGKRVSFDVNFRTDIFRDEAAAVAAYKDMLDEADIIKFSEDELERFSFEYVRSLACDKLVCVSLGGAGSKWLYRGQSRTVPTIKVKPIDTTGAGDAFFAGVLTAIENERAPYGGDALDGILAFANVCGALNTLGRGATDGLPDKKTVEEQLKKVGMGGAV